MAAAEVRAELARQRKTSQALARALGISPQALSRRTSGDLPFDVDELEAAAAFLGVSVGQLLGVGRPQGVQPTVPKVARPLRLVPTGGQAAVTPKPYLQRPLLSVVPGR